MASPNLGRRIDRRFLVAALLLALLGAVALGLATKGPDRATSRELAEGTPGYSDATAPANTAPFKLGAPKNAGGPTTLLLPEDLDTESTVETTTTPPTTEPAAPPVVLPELGAVTDLCGFEANLAPFLNLAEVAPSKVQPLVDRLVDLVGRYAQVAPGDLRATLLAIQGDIGSVRDVLAANGWDPTSAAYAQKVADIAASVGDPQALPALLDRTVEREHSLCG
ncbi:hypothetical protein KSP35_18485 [Aquihabitans sp. G128]|uniref:hypothetical protein n=1 Tax=Aquihabitans sp. G128 TaxID=2849779 RepID=UPI001C220813|nr:hypothetical protein [Aquihabitans sp. G128]QXC60303.1 hypothetical protein KSP35_18485 [Aquihabitans sp. G128]